MLFEPLLKEMGVQMFQTRFDTNRAVQSWKKIRSLKFQIKEEVQVCTIGVAKTKALISCAVTALRLCFRICMLLVFLCGSAYYLFFVK